MRDEICALVKNVGYKQEERASAAAMATQQQQQQPTVVSTTYGGYGLEDATVIAGNVPKSVIIQQRVAEVEDRPAGTTWIFATEESLSETAIAGTNATQQNTNGGSSQIVAPTSFQEGEGDMSSQRTVRRRGSGQHLNLDGEFDDVLAELDEFERQTGGEHYDRQRQQQQQREEEEEEEIPPVIEENTTALPLERANVNSDETRNGNRDGTNMVGSATADDLDQFMDEFEQNTGGEDFRRTSY